MQPMSVDAQNLRRIQPKSAKADLVAASLGEAVQLCIEATGVELTRAAVLKDSPLPATTAA